MNNFNCGNNILKTVPAKVRIPESSDDLVDK